MSQDRFNELGYYAIPGNNLNPAGLFEEVQDGDRLGLGSVWLSERYNIKEAGVICGIAAALTPNMGIANALIGNPPLRNPLILAGLTSTMSLMTNNRFTIGIGRGVNHIADMSGTPRVTFRIMEDTVNILRKLWQGETVNYEGPVGKLTNASISAPLTSLPPIMLAAQGDKTCEWAGGIADSVFFNSLWSPRAVEHCSKLVRRGAEKAGRDPNEVKIWTIQITACESSEEDFLNIIIRRMNTYLYFPEFFKHACVQNGWDVSLFDKLRAELDKIDANNKQSGIGDEHSSRNLDDLRRMRDLYPEEWIHEGHGVGTADEVSKEMLRRFDAGANGICFHGATPKQLEPLLKVWPKYRPKNKFDDYPVNPGIANSPIK